MSKHVAVLMGGISREREVSLVSGQEVAAALDSLGYRVTLVDVGRQMGKQLEEVKPDVAFVALHGTYGEDGCVQGVLEMLGIPYTHSGVLASAVGMDKVVAKRLFESAGIRCPLGRELLFDDYRSLVMVGEDPLPRPYVVKPPCEGSSVGVYIVNSGDNTPEEVVKHWSFGSRLMVEEYIPGRELSGSVFDDAAVAVTELRPKQGFYDYEAKYTDGKTDHVIPADLPDVVYQAVLEISEKAHALLGCDVVSRSDFRYDDSVSGVDGLYLMEVNTHPGLTPTSILPEAVCYAGSSFEVLVDRLVRRACMKGGDPA